MSYQVGLFCYATPVDAGGAACAAYQSASTINAAGTQVISTSCEGVNSDTGALQLRVAVSAVDGSGVTSYQTVEQLPSFPTCQQGQVLDAGFTIVVAALACIVPFYAWKLIDRYMNRHRYES